LRDAGFDIMVDGNKYLLHHKVFIIDAEVPGKARVITGSFNPTKSANERNDENMLIIWNDELVAQYVTEYERVRAKATS
jgi:phosphatidylserine/phosphatidylglycerophosphate/cardiolipin synthase-like enzyme